VALGVQRKEAGEDFVAEVGGPEQAALIGVVVLVGLVEEDRIGALRQVVPAVGAEHSAVHGGVQVAQPLDVLGSLAAVVEAIVGLGHALVPGDHKRGTVMVVVLTCHFELGQRFEVDRERNVSKQSEGV